MTKQQIILGFAGALLLAGGGAFISVRLALSPLPLIAFALGIMCFSLLAVASLATRVAQLEQRLRESR